MSNDFRFINRREKFLIPEFVDDWLPMNHLARFIVEIIDNLNIDGIKNAYGAGGKQAYDPRMLLSLIFYGYATGVFSSRRLESATYDSVAFRYITANEHPDHDTISTFRKRFYPQLQDLFVQILQIASSSGLLKIGTIMLDGTKIKANASKHSALSYKYACDREAALKKEVEEIFRMAEEREDEPLPEGMSIPQELQRREERLEVIAKAKKDIERRAEERYEAERAEYEKKISERKEREERSGKKARGKEPSPPTAGPADKDQVNLTDPDSRIMPESGGGFEQCYNAQASVEEASRLIVGTDVSQNPNDKRELLPMLNKLGALPSELGQVEKVVADAGYYSAENVERCEEQGVEPYISRAREPHYPEIRSRFEGGKKVEENTAVDRMTNRLRSPAGRAVYAKRKSTIEPVFGIIKAVMGFRHFMLRGIEAVRGEWNLVCISYNLKRLHKIRCIN